MMRKQTFSLAPTPAEVAAMAGAAYFLWFLSGGTADFGFLNSGIVAAIIGIGAGMVLSRMVGLVTPRERNLGQAVWALVILGFVVAAPFLASGGFRTSQMAIAGYSIILVMGLNVLLGYTGQASIGSSAFLGIGAYVIAIMVAEDFGLGPLWQGNILLAVVFGTLVAGLAGLVIGIPALRLSGAYLAIATLGLAVVFPAILKLNELSDWTGGRDGLRLFSHGFGPPVDWDWLTQERWYYFLTLFGLGLVLLLSHNMLNTALGRAFRAVRDNEVAAAAMGVHVAQIKLMAFVVSSAITGFGGVFFFLLSNRFVSPESFAVLISIELLIVLVIGGAATIRGAIIGGLFLVYVFRVGMETFANQTEKGGFPIEYFGLDKLKLPFTEVGGDTWLIFFGTVLGLFFLFGNRWLTRQTARYGAVLSPRYGGPVLSFLKLGAAAGIGVGFAGLLRILTDDDYLGLFDLLALRGAITGAMLIVFVLALPLGAVMLLDSIQRLTWTDLYAWGRIKLALAPPEGAPRTPEVSRSGQRQPLAAPLTRLLRRVLGRPEDPPENR
jgi:branched-chain amino acid transport system permease protein